MQEAGECCRALLDEWGRARPLLAALGGASRLSSPQGQRSSVLRSLIWHSWRSCSIAGGTMSAASMITSMIISMTTAGHGS